MKYRNLLIVLSAAVTLWGCSSVYKTGQTPDDVYYSPAPPAKESYVDNNNQDGQYQSYEEYQDSYRNDRFLRMSIGNPYYMSYYNTGLWYDWRYSAYNMYAYYYPYYGSGYYGGGYGYYNPKYYGNLPVASRPVAFNPVSYTHNYSMKTLPFNGNTPMGPRYNNSNNNNLNNGNSRRIYYHSNSTGNNVPGSGNSPSNSYSPSRSYSPSSSGGSGGSGGGGGVSRPTRGH
jgi:uncharacterized membrane protein YgcG